MVRRSLIVLLTATTFVVLVRDAFACIAPPEQSVQSHADLISRTSRIALVELLSVSGGLSYYRAYEFRVVESLDGEFGDVLNIDLPTPIAVDHRDFDGHREPEFWRDGAGRARVAPDCAVSASFEIGSTYLLFLDAPYHVKGFERIEDADDAWLAWVRQQVRL
jgi:hypothetical protein